MMACQGAGGAGMDPYNCPVNPCNGCTRVIIQSQGKAQLCPVCQGSGQVPERPNYNSTALILHKTCHGCGGQGWVVVP